MKRITESTFGTKLANALNLATVLAGFTNYKPPRATESLEQYKQLVASIQEANNAAAAGKQQLSLTVEERQQLFSRHDQSIQKMLSPINAAIKAQYGFTSKAATDVNSKMKALRGVRTATNKVTDGLPASQEQPKRISASHRAFGSIAQSFSDIIASIAELSPAFDPANPELTVDKLKQKHTQLLTVSAKLDNNYAAWKMARASRDSQYRELKDRTRRIKNSVRSQYGAISTEYGLIKSLEV